jgi:hypothetical protein
MGRVYEIVCGFNRWLVNPPLQDLEGLKIRFRGQKLDRQIHLFLPPRQKAFALLQTLDSHRKLLENLF